MLEQVNLHWQSKNKTATLIKVPHLTQKLTQDEMNHRLKCKTLNYKASRKKNEEETFKIWAKAKQLDESQVGIQIAERNINNFVVADDTTLMAENEEELKSLLMRVKVKSESWL